MKLYATTTSERNSRPSKKGADEYIKITLTNNGINIFDIVFTDDRYKRGKIEIMSYCDASKRTIGYCEI